MARTGLVQRQPLNADGNAFRGGSEPDWSAAHHGRAPDIIKDNHVIQQFPP
jgi:hypothetical protein